jgi:RNA polymerase sigma factor (sigma-70 family)
MDRRTNLETVSEKAEPHLYVAALKRGEAGAFAQFVREFQDMVFACGRSVGLRDHELEDAASETFLAAYKYIKSYNGKGKLSSWLWKIAYHKAVDLRRTRSRGESLAENEIEEVAASNEPLPGARLDTEEQNRILWQAVAKLPESQAATIVLFYREDRSIRDIAEILDTPENTVKTWLSRSRSELYTQLRSIQEADYVRR